MPPIQAIAPTHCFRELSPEVPPEVKAQLDLGDLPDLLKTNAHPVASFLRQYSKRQQADVLSLAKAIVGEKNVNKSLRRIREVFSGERLHPFWIKNLAESLAIPPGDLAKARERALEWEAERAAFGLRQQRHRLFARLGPYIKVISSAQPATEAKPPANPRLRLSCDVFSIPGDPDLSEISAWIASHSNTASWGETISGYLYRRHPEEIHFFGREREMLGKRNVECSEAGVFVEIGFKRRRSRWGACAPSRVPGCALACPGLRPRCPAAGNKVRYRLGILVRAIPQFPVEFPAWAPETARDGACAPLWKHR